MPFVMDAIELIDRLSSLEEYVGDKVEKVGNGYAYKMETYAKENAPWHDRTGNARRTLTGFCERDKNDFKIGVMGMMTYSPKLELWYGGKYAILLPTVDKFSFDIFSSVSEVIFT